MGNARRLAAEQQNIGRREGEIRVWQRGSGGKQHQAAALAAAPGVESLKIDMALECCPFEIVHSGAPQITVGEIESGWLDNVDRYGQTRSHAQNRPGIAGNVGLVKRNAKVGQGRPARIELQDGHNVCCQGRHCNFRLVFRSEWSYSGVLVNSNRGRRNMNFMMTVDIHRPIRGRYA